MATVQRRRTVKEKDEEGKARSTCVEPIVNMNDAQLLKNKLSWIQFKLTKNMFTPTEIAEMLAWATDKAELKPKKK